MNILDSSFYEMIEEMGFEEVFDRLGDRADKLREAYQTLASFHDLSEEEVIKCLSNENESCKE